MCNLSFVLCVDNVYRGLKYPDFLVFVAATFLVFWTTTAIIRALRRPETGWFTTVMAALTDSIVAYCVFGALYATVWLIIVSWAATQYVFYFILFFLLLGVIVKVIQVVRS